MQSVGCWGGKGNEGWNTEQAEAHKVTNLAASDAQNKPLSLSHQI